MDRSVPVVAERATIPKLPMGRRSRRKRSSEVGELCIRVTSHALLPNEHTQIDVFYFRPIS
jgi:hypothetical protein